MSVYNVAFIVIIVGIAMIIIDIVTELCHGADDDLKDDSTFDRLHPRDDDDDDGD